MSSVNKSTCVGQFGQNMEISNKHHSQREATHDVAQRQVFINERSGMH